MNNVNKVYIVTCGNNKLTFFNPYSLEEAIESGKFHFIDIFKQKYDREPYNDNEFQDFIESDIKCPFFNISIISGNRLRFNTSKELITYFMNNINKINNNELFDFLLSFVDSYDMVYNYKGEFMNYIVSSQCPSEEYGWDAHIEFTEESCKEGKFLFSYDDIGIDNLYHSPWIRSI